MSVADINRRLYNARKRGRYITQRHDGFRHIRRNYHTLVVNIDGACRNNGYYGAEAAIGIYFGSNSDWNISETLPYGTKQTNQVAELSAAIRALEEATEVWENDYHVFLRLVVVTDSAYVTNGISRWIWKWVENGFRNARGLPVVNGDLFDRLDDLVRNLQGRGCEVNFWQVPRDENENADFLANMALD